MTRHKKFIKSEKAKTKLKGNKLPKGLNVTKTDFKVKKIVIREQLKENSLIQDGSVIRAQDVKELMSKLQHHNATNRSEGLRYLKELVTNRPVETGNHLGTIIQGICQSSLDIEKDVRRESFKALNIVFSTQESSIIAPFFNVITSYLRCAMTHINKQIQEDSLFLLDCLLTFTPELIAEHSDSIFSCFLEMISKLRSESRPDRTLSVNLGSQFTSVKWRTKVLERLLGILKTIVASKKRSQSSFDNVSNKVTSTEVDDAFKLNDAPTRVRKSRTTLQLFSPEKDYFCSLVRGDLNKNCDLPVLFQKSISTAATSATTNLFDERNESHRLKKQIELLMPLLVETWMEVRPTELKNAMEVDEEDTQLTNEAAFSLKAIVDIVDHLIELMKMCDDEMNNSDMIDWFRSTYGRQFCVQFLVGFPYSQCDGFKGSKRKSKGMATEKEVSDAGGENCHHQNLCIAFIFACLNPEMINAHEKSANKVIEYIKDHILLVDSPQILAKALDVILVQNVKGWTKISSKINELVSKIIHLDGKRNWPKEIRSKIFNLICKIVIGYQRFYPKNTFDLWVLHLPKLLLQQTITFQAVKTFESLAKMNNTIFLDGLQAEANAIVANLPEINILGLPEKVDGHQMIVNLFFWLKDFSVKTENKFIPIIQSVRSLRA